MSIFPASRLSEEERLLHESFMRECLALARIASGRGESAVGSVLVRDNEIIGRGIEGVRRHNDFTYHAEIECLREAGARLRTTYFDGCQLYTTHEPCIMCSYVIRQSRIAMVIAGTYSGEKGGLHSRFPVLLDNHISSWIAAPVIVTGILEDECSVLMK